MIEMAIELGFDSLGFSSHAPSMQHTTWEADALEEYKETVNLLKMRYRDRIKIFLGIELDRYSAGVISTEGYDYRIGSVHMAKKDGVWLDFDHSADEAKKTISELFGGDSLAYAALYYQTVAELPSVLDYEIVGHFDVLTKFSERYPSIIDIESKRYRCLALEALHSLREDCEIFEVNTGAISRGHRTTPYPAPFILDEMKRLDCKLVLTSDCHNKDFLDCHFPEAKEYIKAHGFDTLYYLTENGFVGKKI